MKQWSIAAGPAGTLLVQGDPDNPIPVLIQNVDPANTAYLGETSAVNPANPRENVPLLPGQSSIATGDINVYAIAAPGQNVDINTLRGFGSFFQPTNLTNLGGVAIYNTVSAPTQPPTIALNSLWFTPAGGISQWNGSAWVPMKFSGQQIITALSITVGQLAAGIIYAGIIDGTLIQGAQFRAKNAFGATILTVNVSAGAVLQYIDTGSVTQGYLVASSSLKPLTDEFSNSVVGGQVTYWNPSAGNYFAVETYQGNVNFLNASLAAGPWNIYASLEPNQATGAMSYFDNGGNEYQLGNKQVFNNAVPVTVSSTSPGTILIMGPLLQTGQGYHIKGFVQYMGNQATGAAVMSWGSASGLVLGATQVGYQIFTGGGVSPIIHNSSGTLGAVTGPVFAANTTNWLFDFDIYVTVATAGSLTLRAAENSAGNPFVINQAYATIEHF